MIIGPKDKPVPSRSSRLVASAHLHLPGDETKGFGRLVEQSRCRWPLLIPQFELQFA